MSKKSGNFIERYIDKLVMGVVGLVCIWLLIMWVIGGGNSVEYMGKKLGPGQIDEVINNQAKRLRDRLDEKPEAVEAYVSRAAEFIELMRQPLRDVDLSLSWPLPGEFAGALAGGPYDIPVVGEVSEVSAGIVSGVAYVPTEPVSEANPYARAATELADLDLVTVEGKFDISGLYERFYAAFGDEAGLERGYVRPVFAAVDLQRQKKGKDGNWPGEDAWEDVPRAKNEDLREKFSVGQKESDLRGGSNVDILRIQFGEPEVWISLLQPEPYDFDSPVEQWLPPALWSAREKRLAEERAAQEREKRAQAKAEKDREREERRRSASTGGRGSTGGLMEMMSGGGRASSQRRTSSSGRRTTKRGSSSSTETSGIPDIMLRMMGIEPGGMGPGGGLGSAGPRRTSRRDSGKETEEFEKILLNGDTKLEELEELVVWAHDDSAECGSVYRYRMRIGVFNPIAGTEQFSDKAKSYHDDVILWSSFSDATEEVEVPGRLYFFPRTVARAADKCVQVQVSRKLLGKWYSEDFIVRPGEVIGDVKAVAASEDAEKSVGFGGQASEPEEIDYSTGMVLVDVVDVSDWAGTGVMHGRSYPDMLYTRDGVSIEHMPIKDSYWPVEHRRKFKLIKKEQEAQDEEGTSGGRRGIRRSRTTRSKSQPSGGMPMPWLPGFSGGGGR